MGNNKSKKILIITVVAILVIFAVLGGIFTYLMLKTDVLKGSKELFGKYIEQNIETINKIKNSDIIAEYKTRKDRNSYESNIDAILKYSEGGEVSNPLNNLSVKINTQQDIENQYFYRNARILYKNDEYLEVETIQKQELTGIRFTDILKPFITIKNDDKIDEVAKDLGIDTTELDKILSACNGADTVLSAILSTEEIDTTIEKYKNIITESLENASYSKIKKSMITVDTQTMQTNAYIAKLDKEQVRKLVLNILNEIKNDEIILEKVQKFGLEDTFTQTLDNTIEQITDLAEFYDLTITVYEKDGVAVRTDIEIEKNKIIIENYQNGIKIQKTILNTDKEEEQVISIKSLDGELDITIDFIDGENQKTIEFSSKRDLDEEQKISTTIDYTEGIKNVTLEITDTLKSITQDDEKAQLSDSNNITLNDLDQETRQNIINSLKQRVPEKMGSKFKALQKLLGLIKAENNGNTENNGQQKDGEMSQVDIYKFNAKFEFYTGDTVTSTNVLALLDVVKNNLKSVQFVPVPKAENEQSNNNNNDEEEKVNILLNIEKDKENTELIQQIKSRIKEDTKYKVSIKYNTDNELIETITISEVQEN